MLSSNTALHELEYVSWCGLECLIMHSLWHNKIEGKGGIAIGHALLKNQSLTKLRCQPHLFIHKYDDLQAGVE